MTEPKSCPCCKGEGRVLGIRWELPSDNPCDTRARDTIVQCMSCGLSTDPCSSREEAVAKWNRREGELENNE